MDTPGPTNKLALIEKVYAKYLSEYEQLSRSKGAIVHEFIEKLEGRKLDILRKKLGA